MRIAISNQSISKLPPSSSIPRTQAHALFQNSFFAIEVNSGCGQVPAFVSSNSESAIQASHHHAAQLSGLGERHL
jgi:hypothetical protein